MLGLVVLRVTHILSDSNTATAALSVHISKRQLDHNTEEDNIWKVLWRSIRIWIANAEKVELAEFVKCWYFGIVVNNIDRCYPTLRRPRRLNIVAVVRA